MSDLNEAMRNEQLNGPPDRLYGSERELRPIARELFQLGLPSGLRQIDRDTWALDMPTQELRRLEKVHISFYQRFERQCK